MGAQTETATREVESKVPRAVQDGAAPQAAGFEDVLVQRFAAAGTADSAIGYTGHAVMRSPAGSILRALVMRQAQRQFGNRAVAAELRRTTTLVQRHCNCGGTCSACQQSESTAPAESKLEEESKTVQRLASGDASGEAGGEAGADATPSNSPGQTLDETTRARMENHLGSDLTGVRVHTDSAAAESAAALQANAYTVGRDIYFAGGKYQPQSLEGAKLLAHELTHTQQQAAGQAPTEVLTSPHGSLVVGAPDDPLEREAEDHADAFARGEHLDAVQPDHQQAIRRDDSGWSITNNPITNTIAGGVQAAGEFIGTSIEKLAPGATKFFHGLGDFFDDALSKGVDGIFGGILSSVREKGIAGTLESMIGSVATAVFQSVGGFVAGKCAAMGELAGRLVDIAAKLGAAAFDQVKKGFDLVKGTFEDIWSQYGAPALDWVKNKLKAVWKGVEDTARRFWDWLKPLRDRAEAIWNQVTSFLIEGRRKFEDWLEVIVPKAIAAWERLKLKLQPYMEQIKAVAKVAGMAVLLLSPAGPLVVIGGVVYGLYQGVKALWEKWGKPLTQAVRQWWVDEGLPFVEKKLDEFKAKVESAKEQIQSGLQQLYDAIMRVLAAAGVLSFLASVKSAISAIAARIESFKERVSQKLDEWAQRIKELLAKASPYLQQIREFLRQTLLVALVGPLAFLDDGVWHTMSTIVGWAMRTPCFRELGGLLRVPDIMNRLGAVRAGIQQGWEILKHPEPLLEKFKGAIAPLVEKIEPQIRARVAALSGAFTDREKFIEASVMRYLAASLSQLRTNWWTELQKIGWTLLWPWDEVGKEFMPMLAAFGDAISALFNLNISDSIDKFLDGMKKFNGIAGALSGWFMVASVLLGATLGAFGFALGPVGGATVGAGASAGLAFAESIGMGLVVIAVATEEAVIDKSQFDLRFQNPRISDKDQRDQADQEDCKAIAGSLISLITIGALMLLGAVASKFAKFLYGLVKDVPIVKNIAGILESAKTKAGEFSFKKKGGGELGEGGGGSGEPAGGRTRPPSGWPDTVDFGKVQRVLEGDLGPHELSPEEARLAADYYENVASQVKGKLAADARAFNLERARYLREGTGVPPGKLRDFIARRGSSTQAEPSTPAGKPEAKSGTPDTQTPETIPEEPETLESPEEIAKSEDAARRALENPENIRPVKDPAYADRYDVEVDADGHTFRRDKRTGTWCRFSTTKCGLDLGPQAKAAADAAAVKKSPAPEPQVPGEKGGGKAGETPAEGEGLTAKEAALKQRPDVQKLLDRFERNGIPGTEKQILDYIAEDPETRISELNKKIDIYETNLEAQTGVGQGERLDVPSQETGTRGMQIREAHDIGVREGSAAAQKLDALIPSNWENPLGHRGGFGQGFDDLMFKANGDPVVVEYKGGSAELGTNQLSRKWVQDNIDKLPDADPMKQRLQAALDAGKLEGRVYRTPIDANGQPLTTMRDKPIRYPAKPIPAAPVAQPSRRDPYAETNGAFAVHTPGRPLEAGTRAFMEARLDHDFSGVEVHTGAEAGESAESLHAEAYATGRDVYFAPGMYNPGTAAGRRLIAHELAHTMQHDRGAVPANAVMARDHGMAVAHADDPLEHEAEQAAGKADDGRPLDPATLELMQSRLGANLRGVRVHDDAEAAGGARARRAQAFTLGRDIYFGAGKYAPASADGQRLLAHELAHTVQQNGASRAVPAAPAHPDKAENSAAAAEEREAELAAAAIVSGSQVPPESLSRMPAAPVPQLQGDPHTPDIYPDPVDVVWGGDHFHITYQRGTENALIFLEFVVQYTGPHPTHSLSTKDSTVRVRADIAESPLNASLRSQGPSTIAIDLYGLGDRIVHLQDHVSFEDVAKGREHDFSVRDTGRTKSGPTLWIKDPKAAPIQKPDSFTIQGDVPGEMPSSYMLDAGAGAEMRIDGDGDQMKELRVRLNVTSYWPETDSKDRAKGVHLAIAQVSSHEERVFDFELPEPPSRGALFPLLEQVTDGRIPTKVSLILPTDTQWLSVWPPTRNDTGVSYTVQIPGHVVAFDFPPEKAPLNQVAYAAAPGWIGGLAWLDFMLGPYADSFRLTVQSTATLDNKGAAKAILGLTGLYHGAPTGGAFGLEITVDSVPNLKVISASGVSLKIDIDGNPSHALEIFDQLTTPQTQGEDDPERNRYHYVRVVGKALGDRVFYFSVREGGAPRGGTAHPTETDLHAEANSRAAGGLAGQATQGDFEMELDSLDAIAFAGTRQYAVTQNIIKQKTYDDWKALSDLRIRLRPMINVKQVDPGIKALAAARTTELGIDIATDSGGKVSPVFAVSLSSQITQEQWDSADASYRKLMEAMDGWIVGRLKEVRGEHANETEQAQFVASRKAELGKIADKKPIRVTSVFHPDEPIQTRSGNPIQEFPLALYVWRDGGKWYLRDLTNPEKPYDYGPKAGGEQPPVELFSEMDDPDHMPPGIVYFHLPGMYGGQQKVTHHLTLKQALTYAAVAAAIVGITLITAGAATGVATVSLYGGYAMAASMVAGGLAAGVDIAQGVHHGDLSLKRVAMDLGQIVASVAGISQFRSGLIVREAMTAAEAGRPLLAEAAEYAIYHQRIYVLSTRIANTANALTLLVFEKSLYDELVALDRSPGSEPDKARARWLLLGQLAGGAAMLTLSLQGILPSQLGGGRRLILHFPVENGPPVANIGGDVAPTNLKFSQRDVLPFTGDKSMTIDQLADSMKTNGWKGEALNVVELPDGTMVSTDNRRLLAAQKAGLKTVPVAYHLPEEAIPPERAPGFELENNIRQLDDGTLVKGGNKGKIVYKKGATPKNWGEAALFRTANQGNLKEGGKFPLYGRYEQPYIRTPKAGAPPAAPADE